MITFVETLDNDLYEHYETARTTAVYKRISAKWLPFACKFYNINECDVKLHIAAFPNYVSSRQTLRGSFSNYYGNSPLITLYGIELRSYVQIAKTFFHEFTHYKQWFVDHKMKSSFENSRYGKPYYEQQLEIEAFEMQDIMHNQMTTYWNNYMTRENLFL